jgi:hypothetical protein
MLVACITINLQAEDRDVFVQKIKLSTGKGTIYQLLKEVSEQSGYSFIYDSQIIDNNKKVNIRKGEYTLSAAIYAITGNNRLKIDVLGNHILLRLIEDKKQVVMVETQETVSEKIILQGTIYDSETLDPIMYVNVGIIGTTIGTVSNQNGEFQLIIADSVSLPMLKLSHIGYESQELETSLLADQHLNFFLKPKVVLLQEVIVSAADPIKILNDILKHKEKNYALEPVYLTSFYREGIEYRKRNIDVTEAVLQVYKTDCRHASAYDQVKLIKKRRIADQQEDNTLFPKMKSGISSCLVLDIIKELPDFINPANNSLYAYTFKDITTIDNRAVDIITFKQKPFVKEFLYTGDIYVETESKALIEIQFEMNPEFIDKATNYFIVRKPRDLSLTLQQTKYIVSYKLATDGTYYINHIRGDIVFKARKKNHLFSSPLHFWFEMVTCKIDTEDVKSFPRNDRLSPTRVFAETKHAYDKNFWENFNLILPEERLMETMINNINELVINAE